MPAIYAYMLRHTNILIVFFFFNDTATTEIYTLSLHDALPISRSRLLRGAGRCSAAGQQDGGRCGPQAGDKRDRKSTRLNSSHANISYAVFCLKKKRQILCKLSTSMRMPTRRSESRCQQVEATA